MTPLVLSGEIDQYRVESLKQEILAACNSVAPATGLQIDLRAVDHMDASGLQVLLACARAFPAQKLRLEGASEGIQQWFRIAGAETLFEFSDSSL